MAGDEIAIRAHAMATGIEVVAIDARHLPGAETSKLAAAVHAAASDVLAKTPPTIPGHVLAHSGGQATTAIEEAAAAAVFIVLATTMIVGPVVVAVVRSVDPTKTMTTGTGNNTC